MPSTLGTNAKSVFHLEIPSDEIFLEFTVGAGKTIKAGMPVELDVDGKIQPATAASTSTTYIGIALKNAVAGDLVTVGTIGLCVIFGQAKAALDAGPVQWDSYDLTTSYNQYAQVGVTFTNMGGWALDSASAAGDIIRILIKE